MHGRQLCRRHRHAGLSDDVRLRRPRALGLVESVNATGQIILRSAYRYDQYDNVVHEEHVSDLDGSDASNYQVDYDYDGLMRLAAERRSDATGTETESTTYEYDAGDNLVRKVHQVLATVTATPSPTTPLSGGEATPTATPPPPPPPTALRSSPTSARDTHAERHAGRCG